MNYLIKFCVLVLVLTSLVGCGQAQKEGTVRLVLDWTPSTNHTGIYMAQALGFYEEVGITLEIMQPPDSGALSVVASGRAEYGVSFQEELGPALASDSPLPVIAIGGIIQHNTSGIISLKSKGIFSPKDLEGKTLVAWDTPLVAGIMKDLVEGDGGDFSKVTMSFNNVTDPISALESGVDALWVFYAWDGVAVEVAGLETNYFAIADINPTLDYYTPVLVAGTTYAEANPEQVKAFLTATEKGYQYAATHPEEAAKLYVEMVPELSYEMILEGQRYLATRYQGDAPRWGEIDPARWSAFYHWMYTQGILTEDLGESGFTNQYLPQ